jgi:L-amino acid N-acyltransferase YncA
MNVRKVVVEDAEAIAGIYNYYIENTVITFEEDPVSVDTMASRIESISAKYPYMVIEDKNGLIGYAYATEWKARSAYRYSTEVTVYLDHLKTGKGAGSILFSALLDGIKKTNLHVVIGGIALPNIASVALHEKFGFRKVAHFEEIGCKFGRWIDVGYWEMIF